MISIYLLDFFRGFLYPQSAPYVGIVIKWLLTKRFVLINYVQYFFVSTSEKQVNQDRKSNTRICDIPYLRGRRGENKVKKSGKYLASHIYLPNIDKAISK